MTKHTATPWRYKDYNSFALIESVKPYKIIHQSDFERSDFDRYSNIEESKANAKFIVRAVNAHEALVEALRYITDICSLPNMDWESLNNAVE